MGRGTSEALDREVPTLALGLFEPEAGTKPAWLCTRATSGNMRDHVVGVMER